VQFIKSELGTCRCMSWQTIFMECVTAKEHGNGTCKLEIWCQCKPVFILQGCNVSSNVSSDATIHPQLYLDANLLQLITRSKS